MMTRRDFLEALGAAAAVAAFPVGFDPKNAEIMRTAQANPAPATSGGNHYIPMAERSGAKSVVYFTRDLSAAGLIKMYDRIAGAMTGRVGIKLHTGEPHGPNIMPRPWVKAL